MGQHNAIDINNFPKQSTLLGEKVRICFHSDSSKKIEGVCVRDDIEDPFLTIFRLADDRYVLATECMYSKKP